MALDTTHPGQAAPLVRWRRGHHPFFVFIQGLIITHRVVELALEQRDLNAAADGLWQSADLFYASAATMRLAGDMTRMAYDEVRATMTPPLVPEEFSGLLSADHGVLIRAIRKLKPTLENPPRELRAALHTYRRSIDAAYNVERFVGARGASDSRWATGETRR
jgi:hypothetical protein